MLCTKFGWNGPSGSGEVDENLKCLWRRWQRRRTTDKFWSEKVSLKLGISHFPKRDFVSYIHERQADPAAFKYISCTSKDENSTHHLRSQEIKDHSKDHPSLCHFIGKNQNTYKQNLLCIWLIFYLSIQTKSIVGGLFECAY